MKTSMSVTPGCIDLFAEVNLRYEYYQEGVHSIGTYHIRGSVLVQNSPYSIKISIVANDNAVLPRPFMDTNVSPQSLLTSEIDHTTSISSIFCYNHSGWNQ
jgi:hypothetical protein